MDNGCDVVRDLLPLYVDGVCSEGSRALIEEHLAGCEACAAMLEKLRDSACEDSLRQEAKTVMAPRKWRNRVFAVGCTLTAFACVPAGIMATVFQNESSGDWAWLFLMAPALLVCASAILLPLRSRHYTARWTLLGCAGSLMLFLLACGVYSAGMSLVTYTPVTGLFAALAAAVYLLSSAVIVPWAVKELPLRGVFAKRRWLAVAAWILLFGLLIAESVCLAAPWPHYIVTAAGAAGLLIILITAVYLLAKKLPLHRLIRAGLCVTVAGNGLGWLEGPFLRLTGAEMNVILWSEATRLGLLVIATAVGAALFAAGVWKTWQSHRKKSV